MKKPKPEEIPVALYNICAKFEDRVHDAIYDALGGCQVDKKFRYLEMEDVSDLVKFCSLFMCEEVLKAKKALDNNMSTESRDLIPSRIVAFLERKVKY